MTDFPATIQPGNYTLQGMFWECTAPAAADAERKEFSVKKHFMPALSITIDEETPFHKFVGVCMHKITTELPLFLKSKQLHRFFPLKNSSIEFDRETISICLYQNADIHERVYCMIDQGLVCEPNEVIMARLEPIYASHGLGCYDECVYAEE